MLTYKIANEVKDFSDAKILFLEYAKSLNFDLCFQNFEIELKEIEKQYSSPSGAMVLCYNDDKPVGCVGLRNFSGGICEMKRMYVNLDERGHGIGRELSKRLIDKAKELGYKKMCLDTLETMETARNLYKSIGFVPINPYRHNPCEGAIYMELILIK